MTEICPSLSLVLPWVVLLSRGLRAKKYSNTGNTNVQFP